MQKASQRQKRTESRVMHEFKHGELKSGPHGNGGKVKNRKQAIAIALNEAGNSKYKSDAENSRSRAKTASKEALGKTAQQEKEGKSHLGAKDKRESSRSMGGKNATRRTEAGKKAANTRVRGGETRDKLYEKAKRHDIPNRSKMTKTQLENALH
jgi:hypothetical protein